MFAGLNKKDIRWKNALLEEFSIKDMELVRPLSAINVIIYTIEQTHTAIRKCVEENEDKRFFSISVS